MNKFPSEKELEKIRKEMEKAPASQALPKGSSASDRIKYSLCEKFNIFQQKSGLSGRALAEKLEISETVMSRILHYHIEDFTADRLINYLAILYPNVDVKLEVA